MTPTSDQTDDDDDLSADDWEQQRQQSLRTFEVLKVDGELIVVFAHFHESASPGGHLNFMTIAPSGRQVISDSFHSAVWRELHEVHHVSTDDAVDAFVPRPLVPAVDRRRRKRVM